MSCNLKIVNVCSLLTKLIVNVGVVYDFGSDDMIMSTVSVGLNFDM